MNWLRSLLILSIPLAGTAVDLNDWPVYGGDPGGQKFSPLTQITTKNVATLQPAWTFKTGDAYQPKHGRSTAFEATPLFIEGTLYIGTPLGRIIALDPLTGKERWSYDPKLDRDAGYGDFANRGVSAWKASDGSRRIYIATIDARLIAVDAGTGKLVTAFGDNGQIDLRNGLRIPVRDFSAYEETSPPAIIGNTIVVGSAIADNGSVSQPSGEVRAYDAQTGRKKWTWDPIPQDPRDAAAKTWKNEGAKKTGAANAWSVIVTDPQRGLLFIPTGSASPDYYGGERLGDNLYANSIVALHAETGAMAWHFQTVHHDLWDYDVASPPLLFDVHRDGKSIPAVAVGSKTGHLFILNRETGQPIFGVEERPVPKTNIEGEESSPTQPFPVLPKPLAPEAALGVKDIWGPTEEDRAFCKEEISKLRSEGIFTPPSLEGSLLVPGNVGGLAWGGEAYDRVNHLLIAPVNNLPAVVRLIPRARFKDEAKRGRTLTADWEFAAQEGTPFGMARHFLQNTHKLPCTAPPWGMLAAIDADTGEMRWKVPLGQFPGTEAVPGSELWGTLSLGGPMITAGGLVFMGGTIDAAFRAFDVTNGKELWKAKLPSSARSTPMTYLGADGKQYVVIAAGGHGLDPSSLKDTLIAFRLK